MVRKWKWYMLSVSPGPLHVALPGRQRVPAEKSGRPAQEEEAKQIED